MPPYKRGYGYGFRHKGVKKRRIYNAVKNVAVQTGLDAAVGYAVGGKAGAISGAIQSLGAQAGMTKAGGKVGVSSSARAKKYRKRKGRKAKRTKRKNKNPTLSTIIKKGISVCYEKRKTVSTNSAEAMVIGHTNFSGKFLAMNFWRAIIKYALVKSNLFIKDYGAVMTSIGFVPGDVIRLNWFNTSSSTSVSSYNLTIAATTTFDRLAYEFANIWANSTTDDRQGERLDSIQIVPYVGTSFANQSTVTANNVELNTVKITMATTSLLKIQNVTQELSNDNETVDITRVPLTGKLFTVKGNNIVKKSNGIMIPGLFDSANDDALYAAWSKQTPTSGHQLDFYGDTAGGNSTETTFTKPAEVPRKSDFVNCISEKYCTVQPGEISYSKNVGFFTMGVNYLFKLLYTSGQVERAKLNYDGRLGMTKAFYLEKLIGRKPVGGTNDIKLWVELEVKQSALVHGPYGMFTLPINYQMDYDA